MDQWTLLTLSPTIDIMIDEGVSQDEVDAWIEGFHLAVNAAIRAQSNAKITSPGMIIPD